MAATSEADQIRRQMAQIRCDLHGNVEEVVDSARQMVHSARQMTDWRYYVRTYPWASVAVAAAVGYLLVPRRVEIVRPDPSSLAKLAEREQLVVTGRAQAEKRRDTLGQTLMTMALNALLRGAVAYVGMNAGKWMGVKTAEAEQEKEVMTG